VTVGFACIFLLVIAALLLRFGIPRSDLATLANVKWFALVLAVMFAFLGLFALAGMGSAVVWRDARRVAARADLEPLEPKTIVIFEARVSPAMPVGDDGWAAVKSVGSTSGRTPPLVVELSDGTLTLSGESYADLDWPLDEAETHVFLEREQPITVLGKVDKEPAATVHAEQVVAAARADSIQKKARIDFLLYAVSALASLASSPGIPLLLLLAGRRRRKALSA